MRMSMNGNVDYFRQIQEIVQNHGGEICEGETYHNNRTKIKIVDKMGNHFSMTPNDLKNGRWSPYERGRVKNDSEYHLREISKVAESRGGRLVEGQKYINAHTKLEFEDQNQKKILDVFECVKEWKLVTSFVGI